MRRNDLVVGEEYKLRSGGTVVVLHPNAAEFRSEILKAGGTLPYFTRRDMQDNRAAVAKRSYGTLGSWTPGVVTLQEIEGPTAQVEAARQAEREARDHRQAALNARNSTWGDELQAVVDSFNSAMGDTLARVAYKGSTHQKIEFNASMSTTLATITHKLLNG